MLSIFPSLLVFQIFSPLLLRLTLGIIFTYWAYKRFRSHDEKNDIALGVLELVIGIMFILGLYTQVAALISLIIFLVYIIYKIKNHQFLTDGVNYYLILLIISLSLLLTGPGIWAFDLPL